METIKTNWVILPRPHQNKEAFNMDYCYLHGNIETIAGYDCFDLLNGAPEKKGIYECTYKGKKVILFFWITDKKRGLAVFKANKSQAITTALQAYTNNDNFL